VRRFVSLRNEPGTIRSFLGLRTEGGTARRILLYLLIPYAGLVIWIWSRSDVLSTAELHTEFIRFTVADGHRAAFAVDGMRVGELGRESGSSCGHGLFTPERDTRIEYGRIGNGPVEITILPPDTESGRVPHGGAVGLLEPTGGGRVRYDHAVAMQQDEACEREIGATDRDHWQPARLPIWGEAEIGRDFQPASGADGSAPSVLIDGKLDISSHAIVTHSLYEVTSLTLPVGARLQTAPPGGALWWGVVYTDPEKTALVASLATEASSLALFRPNQTGPDYLSASTLAQLMEDPTVIRFHILLLVLAALAAIAEWLAKHRHDWPDGSA
jgi:hypothetical protein